MLSAIDALPECVAICTAIRDATGRIVDFRAEHLNAAARAAAPLPLDATLLAAYARVVDGGAPLTVEHRVAGGARWFEVRVGRHGDGIVAAYHETTARHLAAALLDQSSDGAFAWEPTGRIVAWTAAAERLYGHPASAAVGRTVDELLDSHIPGGRDAVLAALRAGGRWQGRLLHLAADARRIIVDARMRLRREDDGAEVILETARDVTDTVRGDERLRLALAAGRLGIWEWDLRQQKLHWSPEVFDILGVDPRRFNGVSHEYTDLVHPDDAGRVWGTVDRAIAGDEELSLEYRIVRPDGATIWVANRGLVERDAAGAPLRLVGTMADVSAPRAASDAVALKEAQLRLFFEHVPGELTMLDRDLRVLALSRRAAAAQGVDGLRRDLPAAARDGLRRALAGDEAGGEEGALRWSAHPWRDAGGAVGGVILVTEDLAERRDVEARFRRAVVDAPFPIMLHADDGEVIEVNREWTELTGYDRAALPTIDAWTALAYGDAAAEARRAIAGIYDITGSVREGEWPVRTASGETRTWYFSSAPVGRDVRGRRVVVSIASDVTERTAARDALREKRERLDAALAASGTGTFRWDIAGGGLDWDENLDRLFGLSPHESVRSLDAFIGRVHPDDRDGVAAMCRRCADEGSDFAMEFRVVWPDGTIHWVDDRGRTFRDAAGRPAYMTGACVDITERKRADDALRDSEARFRELADAMPQIVWITTPAGVTEYYNRRWSELTGLPADDPTSWVLAVHPDDRAAVDAAWRESFAHGTPFELPLRLHVHTDGGMAYRWYLARALPVRGEDGAVTRWYGTSTDIHAQREIAAALEEAARRKDEFLAMLAHELRNPLTPIRNAVEILRVVEAVGPASRAREMIERQVGHMVRIVDDLLDVSRIARGKISLRREPCDLAALVRHAVDDHRSAFAAADVALAARLPPVPVMVVGDATRLAQVLSNLLHNAHKFTNRAGRVDVDVTLVAGEAVLRVADTGIGMEPEMLRRAFEPFSQADRSLARTRGGLGLGLALVKGLVEMHGGAVAASSAGLGAGAEIVLRLPLELRATASPQPRDAAPIGAPRLRVLLVEDNPDAAESMRLLLELTGHEVTLATDGVEALRCARAVRPDVVLCDLGLPGELDGFGVARGLRADRELAGVRLVAVTGYGQDEDRRRTREVGFDLHLVKPVDFAALAQWIAAPDRV